MGDPEAVMRSMLLASGVLLVVPAVVAGAAAWYVWSRHQTKSPGGPGRGEGGTHQLD